MSLEQKIDELKAAVEANTAALLGNKTSAATKPAAAADAPPKKGPGRPKKEAAPPADDDLDDGLGDGGDGLGDGDDGLGGGEPQYSFEDLMNMMLSLRDIGGKGENKADCRTVIQKFKVTNFKELEGQEDLYDDVAAAIKALAKKRKVDL